ncbi:MAG: hypothetical protein ABIQ17_02215 [Candidatus Limnocylindrales bacterium]
MLTFVPLLTSLLALGFAVALVDQWRERRHTFQLVWAAGMTFFGIAAGCEAIAAATRWSELLYRTWYLTGAVSTAGWLGLGTAFLLNRTRFGYAFALTLFLGGLFAFLTQRKENYADVGALPIIYFIAATVLGLAVAIETYFQNERWPRIAAVGVVGATIAAGVMMAGVTLPSPGYALSPTTGQPIASLFPGTLRLLTPFLNVTGGIGLFLGALFSTYVFMPKRRILTYSLDPDQTGDQFLFNLMISPVALTVNFVASIPGAVQALVTGRLHSRVPSTLLIAIGAIVASAGDTLSRFGITAPFAIAKLIAVIFLLAGFLISIEVFREFRIPFTKIRLGVARRERSAGSH